MGLFRRKREQSGEEQSAKSRGLFGRGSDETETEESAYKWMTLDEALAYSRGEKVESADAVAALTEEACEQLVFLKKQEAEEKSEYSAITVYLTDIQKLDRVDDTLRMEIDEAARTVINLEEDRSGYQNADKPIPDTVYRQMAAYEKEIPDRLAELEEKERYLALVREDMRKLEGEKGSIEYARDMATAKRVFIKKLSYTMIALVLTVFILLLYLMNTTNKSFIVPFFIASVAAICFCVYYLVEMKKCADILKRSAYEMNRATVLLNRVKLKLVNTTSFLEYSYEKYNVNSTYELRYRWEAYVSMKEAESRYRRNTQVLEGCRAALATALERAGIRNADAWLHQPEPLVDRREMADYKSAIETRHRKLKAALDYNLKQQDVQLNELEALRSRHPEQADEIAAILRRYGIKM